MTVQGDDLVFLIHPVISAKDWKQFILVIYIQNLNIISIGKKLQFIYKKFAFYRNVMCWLVSLKKKQAFMF